MSRHHRTLALAVVALVVAWGGVHLLSTPPAAVTPAVWPGAAAGTSPPSAMPSVAVGGPTPTPGGGGGVPILPGAMQQLNASTESTAAGIWALLEELQTALAQRLAALVGQLEGGR